MGSLAKEPASCLQYQRRQGPLAERGVTLSMERQILGHSNADVGTELQRR